MRNSFAVAYHEKKVVILGVTSIMPNLNGVLLNTENRLGYQIEAHDMKEQNTTLNIEYLGMTADELPDDYIVLDYSVN